MEALRLFTVVRPDWLSAILPQSPGGMYKFFLKDLVKQSNRGMGKRVLWCSEELGRIGPKHLAGGPLLLSAVRVGLSPAQGFGTLPVVSSASKKL
jgi:hypothetical protein